MPLVGTIDQNTAIQEQIFSDALLGFAPSQEDSHGASRNGYLRASDGSATAAKFRGPRTYRQVPDAGHNLPQEAPGAFADAVMELMKAG
jgi:pimeloyl-ACP methyl ester carboxylesterase